MTSEKQCPWCDNILKVEESSYSGPQGKMKILRCESCQQLISVRHEGEPMRIIKKELIQGG